jgi:cholest-4-en-3-one 26-monooxygenase
VTGAKRAAERMMAIDPLDLVDPGRYAARGYPHETWTRLRAEAPIAYIEAAGYKPFWAITKHADIMEVAKQPQRFSSAQGITLAREGARPFPPTEILVMIDPPRHGPMRRVVNARFTPKAVRARQGDVDRIALDIVDGVATAAQGGTGDFVSQIAAPFPLAVIAWIIGVPSADWGLLFRWTNEIIGKDDPEFRRPDETPGQTIKRARGELRAYFERLVETRRDDPQDDLVSGLLGGTVDGAPLTDEQLLSYCELFVEAGNETTRNAISGGLLAFCEHPAEWEKLRANPDLLPEATEEILRWSSPISHFTRVATEDCAVHGVQIAAGDQLALYFASANRDEDVFDDPFSFRVDRTPNPHLAFGFGEHVCLGAHLARVEIETIFRHLLTRLGSFELAGHVERLTSAVNGSIKQLPLRYRSA